jgi:hypothetical protein
MIYAGLSPANTQTQAQPTPSIVGFYFLEGTILKSAIRIPHFEIHSVSRPVFAVQAAVLNGFGQVLGPDVVTAGQIGNGTGHLQNPVISTG